ncbi:MAG: phosphatase PAP2 family protein [Sphingobacteriales bacterium]|nr:phosphatase PAP2 family protein [Sphingobacteriales bacterium]
MLLILFVDCLMLTWVLGYYGHFLPLPKPTYYQYFTIFLISIVQPIVIYTTIRNNYNSSNHLKEPLEIEFSDQEIKLTGDSFYTVLAWTKIFKVVELKNWFLIYQNNLSAVIIPKKSFSPDDEIEMKRLLRSITSLNLQDGLIIVFTILLLLLYNTRLSLQLLLIFLVSTIIVHLFKDLIYVDHFRPVYVFKHLNINLHTVSGIELHEQSSFPSGHSTTAFTFFAFTAIAIRQNFLKLLCCLLAITIAYSRVYLSQHFLADIFAGSVIGVATVFITMAFSTKIPERFNAPLRKLLTKEKEPVV